MDEGEDKQEQPKIRYRGGISKDSELQNDPHSLGFGDLVRGKDEPSEESSAPQFLNNITTRIAKLRRVYKLAAFKTGEFVGVLIRGTKTLVRKIDIKAIWEYVKSYDYSSLNKKIFKKLGFGEITIIVILLFLIVPQLRSGDTSTPSQPAQNDAQVSGAQDTPEQTGTVAPIPQGLIEVREPVNYERNDELGYVRFLHETLIGSFTITQQALPAEFEDNNAIFDWLQNADGKVSIDRIPTDKGLAYVLGKNDGTKHAWLAYNDILVIISTRELLSVDDWKNYINTL